MIFCVLCFIVASGEYDAMTTKPKKTWKRGRKAKPPGEKQTERAVVYLTPADAKKLRKDCEGMDMTPSVFLTGLWREWRTSREK